MIIEAKVNTKAKYNNIIYDREMYKIYLTTPPLEGRANKALIKLLADYFHVSQSRISIIQGEKNKYKIIEVNK